ncbi:hypothetical protein Tco_0966615 [Tanacetum coccineum]
MVDPEKPLKKKGQIALDEEIARNLEAHMQAELIKEESLARQKKEETNIVLIESWNNTQAMMEADFELTKRLQAEEHGEITIEERSRLFVELMNRRKKHFVKLRAEEIRRNPPTKAQKRNQMSTYLKNMAGFKHMKGSETRNKKESSKIAGDELESNMSKKQKIDESCVSKLKKDDQEVAEMNKMHFEIVTLMRVLIRRLGDHLEVVKSKIGIQGYRGSGYQQKDRKPSQNDKTEHGMEKTVQNQGQSPKMPKSESILKNQ